MRGIVFLYLLITTSVFGQPEKPKNYSKFDNKTFRFGMMLGGNSSDFRLLEKLNIYDQYGVKSISGARSAGGQFGPLVSMKLGTPVLRLRFNPNFSFEEKVLNYVFEPLPGKSEDFVNQERVNSANFNFPLLLQFRALRLNNFGAYWIAGGQYTWDMQSQKDASQDFIDPFIKLNNHDWQAQLGVGAEFYFPYFKLGLELKYAHSMVNSLIQDDTFVSQPIDKLYNRLWSFSLIIEG